MAGGKTVGRWHSEQSHPSLKSTSTCVEIGIAGLPECLVGDIVVRDRSPRAIAMGDQWEVGATGAGIDPTHALSESETVAVSWVGMHKHKPAVMFCGAGCLARN